MTTEAPGRTGCRPRFATPRCPGRPSLGPGVGEVAERLGKPLMDWQQLVVDVALELDPDGSYHYDEIVLTVPRQSGKTALVMAMAVHRLVILTRDLGRQRLTYTAQQRQKARLKLERDFAEILREAAPSFREVTNVRARPQRRHEWKLSLNNGAENIQFGHGNYLQIDAPSRTGGHGDTLDVGVIDEAFAHSDDTIETGMEPSMATRANHQLWVLSTAGDAQSKYLWRKTLAGRKACKSGNHGRTAYFEWSAPEDADPADPVVWDACSPALGCTITRRFLEGQWEKALRNGQEGVDKFRRSYLNQWPEIPTLEEDAGSGPFPAEKWGSLADPEAERGRNVVFGVDVDEARVAHVAVAWRRPDGAVQVMLADTGLSPLRTPARLNQLAENWGGRVVLGGASAVFEADVRRAVVMTVSQFAAACGRFEDLFEDGLVRHGNQPELNDAVKAARWRKAGSSGEKALQLRDAPAAGPLAAVMRALHGLLGLPVVKPAAPASTARETNASYSETADLSSLSF